MVKTHFFFNSILTRVFTVRIYVVFARGHMARMTQ